MARSYHSIIMDYREAIRQAERLDETADRMSDLANRDFESTLNSLAQYWKSDNSVKYMGKGKRLQGNMNRTQSSVREAAEAIREIAQTIYDAEMEAWERAHDRD